MEDMHAAVLRLPRPPKVSPCKKLGVGESLVSDVPSEDSIFHVPFTQVSPTCEINHVPIVTGLESFAKLHPQSVGMQSPKEQELLGIANLDVPLPPLCRKSKRMGNSDSRLQKKAAGWAEAS